MSFDLFGIEILRDGKLTAFADSMIATPLKVVLIILAALVAKVFVGRAITRFTRRAIATQEARQRKHAGQEAHEGSRALYQERRRQRAETTESVLQYAATITIFTIAFVMLLGEVGLQVGPIIASAGIVGLALGFGAQEIVRDFLSGLFMLMEDQYGVGDVIDITSLGGTSVGTVEAVSLRISRLRDVEGNVLYVRNGEVRRVSNMSQGWARAVLDVPVSSEADVPRVREVLKETAHDMWKDGDWKGHIVDEPQVWGVEALSKDAVMVRVVVPTAPLKQWEVARQLRERLKAELDREGIALSAA